MNSIFLKKQGDDYMKIILQGLDCCDMTWFETGGEPQTTRQPQSWSAGLYSYRTIYIQK